MLLIWKVIGLSPVRRLSGAQRGSDGGCLTHLAFVQVLVAGGACVAGLAQAKRGARQGVGAALGVPVAGLAQAPVLQVTQEACGRGRLSAALGASLAAPRPPAPSLSAHTCAARRAEAGEGAHAIDAGGSGGAGGRGAVVQVLLAACAAPAADTHAVEAASRVPAGAAMAAARGALWLTLVHVFRAVPACRRGRARAGAGPGGEAGAGHLPVSWASRTHLSRPLGRGRCRCPAHPGKCRHSDTGARHSHPDSPRSAGL